MSIALSQKVKELERRIAELEARVFTKCDSCAGPIDSTEYHQCSSCAAGCAPPEPLPVKRKPGRPPKNG